MKDKPDHISKPNPNLEALNKAKKLEEKKLKKGYTWMRKGKTEVLVPPEKKRKYLKDGYKPI